MIKHSQHAKKKFSDLRQFGIFVTKPKISKAINQPKYRSLDNSNIIVAVSFDKQHNLRIVYKKLQDDTIVITFYVYRKGRYDEY